MLILSRNEGEDLILRTASGEEIVIRVLEHRGRRTRLGIDAPASVQVRRAELPGWDEGNDSQPRKEGS